MKTKELGPVGGGHAAEIFVCRSANVKILLITRGGYTIVLDILPSGRSHFQRKKNNNNYTVPPVKGI